MVNFLQNMPLLPTGGCCRIGREYRLTRRYTGCVLARKVNGCPACRMHTGVLSHRETSGWTALVGDSPAGCQVRPTADAVAATGTAALFDHRVLLLVAKCGFNRPAPLVVPAFFCRLVRFETQSGLWYRGLRASSGANVCGAGRLT